LPSRTAIKLDLIFGKLLIDMARYLQRGEHLAFTDALGRKPAEVAALLAGKLHGRDGVAVFRSALAVSASTILTDARFPLGALAGHRYCEHKGSDDERYAEPRTIRVLRRLVARRAVRRTTSCSPDHPRK